MKNVVLMDYRVSFSRIIDVIITFIITKFVLYAFIANI